MDANKLDRLERLLNRALSAEEKERLRRIKDTLEISDNDALWDVITAMEYQRTYYEELPDRIAKTASEIFAGLSQAAEKEVALAQGRLTECVVKQAEKLSIKDHAHTWLMWGIITIFLLLLYGSLLLWAGYCIGSEQTQPPAMLLRMPVGLPFAALCLCAGIFSGTYAAREFSVGNDAWRKPMLAAIIGFLSGALILAGTLF